MKNPISTSPAKLATQISEAIPGVVKYTALLGLAAGLEAALTAELAALELAINNHEQGKIVFREARKAVRQAMKACRTFVTLVREMVKPTVGSKYSEVWDAFGFNSSLKIPTAVDAMWEMLGKLIAHLAANPALANTELNINAAQATALRNQLLNAKTALNEAKGDLQRLIEARDMKVATARIILRGLTSTLRLKLGPLDSYWVEFGLNKPGAQPTPDAPTGLTAVMITATDMLVKWPAVPRAQHYRFWKRVVGTDDELVFMANTTDLEFLMELVPGNSQVEVALSAVNDGGESVMSTIVTVLTQ